MPLSLDEMEISNNMKVCQQNMQGNTQRMGPDARKLVFGGLQLSKVQTNLLSYED